MKRFLSLILALLLCLSLTAPALAAGDADIAASQDLNALGLFAGKGTLADGTPDFALGDKMNRMEAVTMLVRLLGAEQTALAEKNAHPFTDVAAWADPYVGYAYANKLTLGQGNGKFGGADTVNAQQFATFVLRALGYSTEKDFNYSAAESFAAEAGLAVAQGEFDRGSAAALSRSALGVALAGQEKTLAASLAASGAVDAAVCAELDIPMEVKKPEVPAFESAEFALTDGALSADALLERLPTAKWVLRSNGNADYYMMNRDESELPTRKLAAYADTVAAYLADRTPDSSGTLRTGGSVKLRLDQGSNAFVFVLDADYALLAWGQCCGADTAVTLTAPAFDAAAPLSALREAITASLEAAELPCTQMEPDEYGNFRVYPAGLGEARYYAAFVDGKMDEESIRATIVSAVADILFVQKVGWVDETGSFIPMYYGEMCLERDDAGAYAPAWGSGHKLYLFYGDDGVIESYCVFDA